MLERDHSLDIAFVSRGCYTNSSALQRMLSIESMRNEKGMTEKSEKGKRVKKSKGE
jgi:hypothetical protein